MNSPHYISYSSGAPIYTSRTVKHVPVGRSNYLMSYGDRISVRVSLEGESALQYETRRVADMTDLTGDLRRRAKGKKGLAVVNIRNHDRGWTREIRIKLYPQRLCSSASRINAIQVPMFFPWEI